MAHEAAHTFTAELAAHDSDPKIGDERIVVRHDDGRTEELRLHDYGRLYELPGVYEQIVHGRLGCRSPDEIAAMLASAVDLLGWERHQTGVLDVAAGNGLSGEALAAHGLGPLIGTDIVTSAREAALRDRPTTYEAYLTLDLLDLASADADRVKEAHLNALACVAPVGEHSEQLPPGVLAAAAGLLAPESLVAYMHDPSFGTPDPITSEFWTNHGLVSHRLITRRYVHRHTVNGKPYEMDGVVWRIRRTQDRR